ncbi:hypothetical protein I7I53_10449 [Histoplasma capsulatum var. duboisii H88]|uniref:Uncharacterized protein n=1 Tax=Ajellomyces capsulatus (strain H88) TaxID=544711 RepID=A0A8A1L8N0_AJEC8|nr:hypothetical protein I7I53_10449 [Histoplasma capsulatum var. duboisii H88]
MRTNGSHSLINTNKRKTIPFVAQQRMFMKTLRAESRCWTETRRRETTTACHSSRGICLSVFRARPTSTPTLCMFLPSGEPRLLFSISIPTTSVSLNVIPAITTGPSR